EVSGRRLGDLHPRGPAGRGRRGGAPAVDPCVPRDRLRRDGARRLPAAAPRHRHRRQRGEHDPRVHDDQHVLEALGGVRRRLPDAPRSADRARARASCRQAAPPHQPDMRAPRRAAALVIGAVAWAGAVRAAGPAPARTYDLRGGAALARVYDTILDARFDQVEAELGRACGPAPAEACVVLAATSLWWQILLDPASVERDRQFAAAIARAIEQCEAWTARAPDDPEAWFYLGGAYAARVQWRVLREEKLAAARDGKHIRQALDRAVALAPDLDDAYFGIGLYKYYADVAPAAAKILRFLLLLPGGDRRAGLAEMVRARERGRLLQGEADYQLHLIYLWYEQQTDTALGLLEKLHEHYPANPLFL